MKTTISEIYKKHSPYDKIFVATLSGRAADVLRKKGVKNARTIQSLIYGKPKFEWWQRVLIKNSKMRRTFQERGEKNIFIFDEASMIIDWNDPTDGWKKKTHDLDAIVEFSNNNPIEENFLMFVGDEINWATCFRKALWS